MPAYQVGRLIVIVIVVGEPVTGAEAVGSTVVYARVSSGEQRRDLERQVARVTGWATGQHLSVDLVVTPRRGPPGSGHCREWSVPAILDTDLDCRLDQFADVPIS